MAKSTRQPKQIDTNQIDEGMISVVVRSPNVAVRGVRKAVGDVVSISLHHYEQNKDRFERV